MTSKNSKVFLGHKSPFILRKQLCHPQFYQTFNNKSAEIKTKSADTSLKLFIILIELRIAQLCSSNELTLEPFFSHRRSEQFWKQNTNFPLSWVELKLIYMLNNFSFNVPEIKKQDWKVFQPNTLITLLKIRSLDLQISKKKIFQ